jgi:hypothetical protein
LCGSCLLLHLQAATVTAQTTIHCTPDAAALPLPLLRNSL